MIKVVLNPEHVLKHELTDAIREVLLPGRQGGEDEKGKRKVKTSRANRNYATKTHGEASHISASN